MQARMAGSIHGLPKVSPGPALPNPSTSCGWAAPETAVFYPLGYPTPYGPEGMSEMDSVSYASPSPNYPSGTFCVTLCGRRSAAHRAFG
jgi:hypothetical protein